MAPATDLAQPGMSAPIEQVQWRRGRGRALGVGIAAGVLGGLAIGALANRPRQYEGGGVYPAYEPEPDYAPPPVYVRQRPAYGGGGGSVEACMQRYRSYNPNTGMYTGYDGIPRPCP